MRALILALVVVGAPAWLSGQEPDELVGMLDSVTTLWERSDAARLAALSAGGGLDLEIRGDAMGPLAGHRASAALRQLFSGLETVSVVASPPSRLTGADDRAFVELSWETRQAGGAVSERSTVFVGLVRESAGWRVSQIRVFP